MPIRAYRVTLSPFVGGQCRFEPTCSRYALEAYHTHGPFKGTRLTLWRLARCHPFIKGGYDPVPPAGVRGERRAEGPSQG
ncbi:MAG: membrane protein insertion efficiency factor YidD [Phycisphaerales bacterium]